MSIRIITHVYAKHLHQYEVFLRVHLSSLVIFPPKVKTSFTIFYSPDDSSVKQVLSDFKPLLYSRLESISLEPNKLFRRSIGRNLAALKQTDDLIWFSDVDHFFGYGCLDELWTIWSSLDPKPAMVWPSEILIHRDHKTGDVFWKYNLGTDGPVGPSPQDFEVKQYWKAIGGVQIVSGDFARKYGYLKDFEKWQRPRDDDKPFGDFRDDVQYRKFCGSKGELREVEIPNLFRLRHSETTYR